VDQNVGRHVIDQVLGSSGLLSGKTRILATNSIPVLKEADFVALLRNKTILEKGTYQQLMAMRGEVANLIRTASSDETAASSPSETSLASQSDISESSTAILDTEEVQEGEETLGQLAPIKPANLNARKTSMATLRRASTVSWTARPKVSDEEGGLKSRQTKETHEQGKVKWTVYWEYAKDSNLYAVSIYMVALMAAQTASVGGTFWLKKWSEVNEEYGSNPQVGKYIGIYFAFGIGSAALVVLQTLILWILCSIEVSCSAKTPH
jgi:ATP-binding cassette, subfamily C (CFTR/MRP), member 1